MSTQENIEFSRSFARSLGMFIAGVMFLGFGALLVFEPPKANLSPAPGSFFGLIGLMLFVGGARRLFTNAPRFRATAAGIWFGGGSIIPWADVKNVYEVALTARSYGVKKTYGAIAFDFHRRSTLLRAPVACWLASPFGVGDIDISTQGSSDRVSLLASRLEAMRGQADLGRPPDDDTIGR